MSKERSECASVAQRIAELSPQKRALLRKKIGASHQQGHDLVSAALRQVGVRQVYGVSGNPTDQLLPAVARENIRPIGVYHQFSAVCMALAHNYQAGALVAAAIVSSGPAVTNAMTGLLVARDNAWPVIVLGGRRSSFQQFESAAIIRELTKHFVSVSSSASIDKSIYEAYQIAMSGRPGPVYVEFHEDVLNGFAATAPPGDSSISAVTSVPTVSDSDIDRIATALLTARRPALLMGKGVRWSVSPKLLRKLIERLDLPLITSPMGRGFVPEDHPLCFNQARTALQSQADVVLILGARLNWMFRHGSELSRDAAVFRVDIHEDEEDEAAIETQFVHGDAGDFVARLFGLIERRKDELASADRRHSARQWLTALRAASSEMQVWLDERMSSASLPMSPYRMMKEVRDALPRDAICVTEGNISMLAAQPVIPAFEPASRMDAGTNACMGIGIPYAIGAKAACPDRPVVAVVGDYGFSLTAMEMEVAVRHGINIVVVVANNQGNNGALKQKRFFPEPGSERVTMFQPELEYDRIMKTLGGAGATVSDPDALRPAITRAIASGVPSCINVVVDPDMPLPNGWGKQSVIVRDVLDG